MNRKERVIESLNQNNTFISKKDKKTACQLVELLTDCDLISETEKIFVIKLNEFDFKAFKKSFEGLSKQSDSYFYIWIGLTEEDNVVVVGRTSFSKEARTAFGDLFHRYSIFGQSITQEIILNIIEPSKIDYLEDLNNRLNDFIVKAIIIPIDVLSNKEASIKETEIGDFLIKSKIPILNIESHKKY